MPRRGDQGYIGESLADFIDWCNAKWVSSIILTPSGENYIHNILIAPGFIVMKSYYRK